MASCFWENTDYRLLKLGKSRPWLAREANVGESFVETGIQKRSSPSVDRAYAVAKVFNVSIEELVDGENGEKYIRELVLNNDMGIRVPERILPFIEPLLDLSERDLRNLLSYIRSLAADPDKRVQQSQKKCSRK